jgi:hypothetical protein
MFWSRILRTATGVYKNALPGEKLWLNRRDVYQGTMSSGFR